MNIEHPPSTQVAGPWSKLFLGETFRTDTVSIPFYSSGNQSTERFCNLPKVTQPAGGRAEIRAQDSQNPSS